MPQQNSPSISQLGGGHESTGHGQSAVGQQGMPAMPPAAAPPSGSASSRAFPRAAYGTGRTNGSEARPGGAGILVRSHTGFGEVADFDPGSGALRGVALGVGPVGGVYGDLGAIPMVFYRDGARLTLRAGERVIDLEDPYVGVEWQRVDNRSTRLVVSAAGTVLCDVSYPAMLPDLDLGLLIRDVLADPDRRTRIFAR